MTKDIMDFITDTIAETVVFIAFCLWCLFVTVTFPIWIVPYYIYRERKEKKQNDR